MYVIKNSFIEIACILHANYTKLEMVEKYKEVKQN